MPEDTKFLNRELATSDSTPTQSGVEYASLTKIKIKNNNIIQKTVF